MRIALVEDNETLADGVANLVLVRIGVADSTFAQLGTWLPLALHNLLGEKAVFLLTRN